MRRFSRYVVWSTEVEKKVVQSVTFLRPKFGERPPQNFEVFVNRHHFRPTGQVWLRSHGWSFIYADKIKKEKIDDSGKI